MQASPRRLASGGFGGLAAWRRRICQKIPSRLPDVTFHLPSGKRSQSFTRKSRASVRLHVGWGEQPQPSPANCVEMLRGVQAAAIIAPRPPNGMRIYRLSGQSHRSWRRTPGCGNMFRKGCLAKSARLMARKYRGQRSNGRVGKRGHAKVVAGRAPGAPSRLLVDYHWTFLTIRRCGSVTKQSIKPSSFKRAVGSDATSPPAFEQEERCGRHARAPEEKTSLSSRLRS
jgi:hypothetical protein